MSRFDTDHPHYKWVALSNTTVGMFLAVVNSSIVLISLPAIFRGIGLDPLAPGNVSYLLWMLMGYLLVTAVLVVTLGRLGDIYGRVKIYNLGFVVFTVASVALALDPLHASQGALWLIVWRVVQGIGGAMLMANSTAILTDAFPANQRGFALGINQVAGHRRLVHRPGRSAACCPSGTGAPVFWVSVPFGVVGTVWSYRSLHELGGTTGPGQDRLVGQRHLRGRPDVAAGRDHLRHPALRRRTPWAGPTRGCSPA